MYNCIYRPTATHLKDRGVISFQPLSLSILSICLGPLFPSFLLLFLYQNAGLLSLSVISPVFYDSIASDPRLVQSLKAGTDSTESIEKSEGTGRGNKVLWSSFDVNMAITTQQHVGARKKKKGSLYIRIYICIRN